MAKTEHHYFVMECDRCDANEKRNVGTAGTFGWNRLTGVYVDGFNAFDICPTCSDAFRVWIANETTDKPEGTP
jgi:hypothetical protein